MRVVLALIIFLTAFPAAAGQPHVVFYRIGESGNTAWSLARQQLEAIGFSVSIHKGEMAIEKHVEKVNRINRSPGSIFLALEFIPGEKGRIMVAEPEVKKGEGRFLTIDEMPGQFAAESKLLARSLSSSFEVKTKSLPLFPLLGVNMPGALVRMEFREEETHDVVKKLRNGIEKYFRKGLRNEK